MRCAQWYKNAKLFIHPSWEHCGRVVHSGYDGMGAATDGLGIHSAPDGDWPVGDGSRGMIEGADATIRSDGTQLWRYFLRADCMGESSMAMALSTRLGGPKDNATVAANLNDFIYFHSVLAQGQRAEPTSPTYGLVSWTCNDPDGGVYYGDDNARCMLGTLAAAAVLGEHRWDEALMRCLLANLRTTGPLGFRNGRLNDDGIRKAGWRHYWTTERTHYAPHFESWLWACYLWAYERTRFRPFLDRATKGIGMMLDAYPDSWQWTNGLQQERARMLLPLAWLVRVEDCPRHRKWLHFMAGQLLASQDSCGAIREEVGSPGKGACEPPASNDEYGTGEAPLIQTNGDPLCDLLYTTNFAFVGLHEAVAATGEACYVEAENKLAAFLCRIQVRSEAHPRLDGAWFRAFDFRRWEYWASCADSGWAAWAIESGWTQAWITSVLAMRCLGTSLWDLTAESRVAEHFPELVAEMLPGWEGNGRHQSP